MLERLCSCGSPRDSERGVLRELGDLTSRLSRHTPGVRIRGKATFIRNLEHFKFCRSHFESTGLLVSSKLSFTLMQGPFLRQLLSRGFYHGAWVACLEIVPGGHTVYEQRAHTRKLHDTLPDHCTQRYCHER